MFDEENKFENIINVDDDWEILSDDGFQKIDKICKTKEYDVWHIKTENNELFCADNHILFDSNNNEIFAKDIKENTEIKTSFGYETVLSVEKTTTKENMYDVQINSEKHTYFTNNILSHNTTITTAWILHYILFNDDKNVALLANKAATAREIMSRIQLAYIHLPKWIQSGVKEWNKGSFSLENGSKVMAAATSSDSVRGQSFSCVTGDTIIEVYDNKIKDTKKIPIWQAGKYNFVMTEKGLKRYDGLLCTANKNHKIHLTFSDGTILKCTPEHKILVYHEFVEAKDLKISEYINAKQRIDKIEDVYDDENVFDLLNVDETHSYYTNGILSHNCVFIDECIGEDSKITVRDKETGEIKQITMKELYDKI